MKPLQGMLVLDLSHRLPGPLCGHILASLGAEVIKIEDHFFQDPFLSGLFADFDDSFIHWYHELNAQKKIKRFDYKNADDQKQIKELIARADIIIDGLPEKVSNHFGLNDLTNHPRPACLIRPKASHNKKQNMHDVNSLAESGLLPLHLTPFKNQTRVAPPMLPFAGITFGHKLATDALAGFIKATKDKKSVTLISTLDDATETVLSLFWPKKIREKNQTLFLHNGKFPCYNIYKTKDLHFVALAAVEEKFWSKFCSVFKLDFEMNERFDVSGKVFSALEKLFNNHSLKEIQNIAGEEELCLSFIEL
jgi:crotonobetainyl-CoA:carnitine CoA-transferase CaiB-like acyl-CoA transferase